MEDLIAEKVDERLRELSANRMAARQRPEFCSVAEAAELLRCGRQRIYDLCSAGRLTRLKDGSRTLLRRTEVEAYIGATAR